MPASKLWLKLQELPRPTQVVDFPRMINDEPVGKIAMRVLTQEEQMICTAAAEEVVRKHMKDARKDELGYERLFTDAVCVEVLYRACRDADDPTNTVFPTPKDIRSALTTEECAKLFEHYITIQLELGPTVATMSDEEMEAWIDRLVEGGSAFPLDLLSSDQRKLLTLYMAYQLRTSPTDTFSAGWQPDESTPSDSEKPPPEADEAKST
jgi:ssRNA-specific RNase YbeY (16S rRNA maturation enzyme)